jgi:acetolactate synthase-1/2/3 large subunit
MVLELGLTNTRSRQVLKDIRAESPYDRPDFAEDGRKPIPPDTALANLQAALPEARFTSDIGEHMLFCLHYLKVQRPGDFSMQLGLGSMGSGIAGATGLALADPERPVVCVCGDGGMQMSGMEILTAKKLGLKIVYAVFNDSRYNMVYHGMKQLYGEAQEFDAPEVDFSAWARSMGVPAMTIVRGGEITSNLVRSLLSQGGPALLDIRIDREMRIRGGGRVESLQRMSVSSGRGV